MRRACVHVHGCTRMHVTYAGVLAYVRKRVFGPVLTAK
jgi:hypothetical protein